MDEIRNAATLFFSGKLKERPKRKCKDCIEIDFSEMYEIMD
jgi:hypothetical protein